MDMSGEEENLQEKKAAEDRSKERQFSLI